MWVRHISDFAPWYQKLSMLGSKLNSLFVQDCQSVTLQKCYMRLLCLQPKARYLRRATLMLFTIRLIWTKSDRNTYLQIQQSQTVLGFKVESRGEQRRFSPDLPWNGTLLKSTQRQLRLKSPKHIDFTLAKFPLKGKCGRVAVLLLVSRLRKLRNSRSSCLMEVTSTKFAFSNWLNFNTGIRQRFHAICSKYLHYTLVIFSTPTLALNEEGAWWWLHNFHRLKLILHKQLGS